MGEQRTVPPSSSRPARPPSVSSLRHYRSTQAQAQSHSRRQSVDTAATAEAASVSNSPITYFPHPNSFAGSTSPITSNMPIPSRPPSMFSHEDGDEARGGTKTPTGPSSPRTVGRSSVVGTSSRRTLPTPVAGYGATHNTSMAGLGLGMPDHSTNTSRRDGALSSPRRISTSHVMPPLPLSAREHRPTHSPSLLNPPPPTHENYYSNPSAVVTPRFKDRSAMAEHRHSHSHSNSAQYTASTGTPGFRNETRHHHSRHLSTTSAIHTPAPSPKSPQNSVLRRLRHTASRVGLSVGQSDEYDVQALGRDEHDDDQGRRANGTRVWYSSYVTIDWIHDAIKESARVRRLRGRAGHSIRGYIANAWDRFQGWLVVTLIGITTAIIAFLIIRTEMALFDLKEGFCSTSWGTAKRFCCAPHHRGPTGGEEEVCGDWVEWGQVLDPSEKDGPRGGWVFGAPEFMAYGLVAVALACLASCLTIYLSSSAHHCTSKDSTFLVPSPSQVDSSGTAKSLPPGKGRDERQPLLDPPTPGAAENEEKAEFPRKVMFYAAGSGIPEIKTILSGFVIHGYLGGWTLLTKSVGLALSVASGLSLGKEGPLVHIACCVGNIISRLFTKFECNEAKRREVLSAACAAGVSVAFGAPIGGVLFSLEEVSYYFPPKVLWRSFWCAAVAAITLKSLNPFGNGSLVLFTVSFTKEYHYWEYAIFIILGIFGGLYGAVFSRLNILWAKHIRQGTWVKRHPIIEVMLVTILTTIVSFLNPYCRMGGTELVASLFAECRSDLSSSLCVDHPRQVYGVISMLGAALLVKGALTIITFGIKLPAGIFIPSLVVGACFGRIVGLSMEWIEWRYPLLPIFGVCRDTDCIVPGLYAMVGAAATLAGVTRTTVSLAVIVLELTGTLNYVVPVMLGVLVAKTVADGLEKKGIYDLVIDLNQLPYLDAKHEYLWGGRRVSEIADRHVPYLRADKTHTVRTLTGKLLESARLGLADTGFPVLIKDVISEDGRPSASAVLRVVGFLGMNELEHALSVLADEPDANLNLMPDDMGSRSRASAMSIFSFAESESVSDNRPNPYDISRYIDRAPITVQMYSPLELVQQLFVKLGARQLLVTDSRGVFKGMVTKKAWLSFLSDLEREQN
ncbi:putative voltage-gated chloride channel [Naematelia encephala]|uniref:Chloride channel protein n=1 Tax=Naematelia encephala TaxID=71784 RepID=A0A1Y2BL15_9TREE|nr:putative voltage-gated chloride channel [Naematelia encephala]